MNQPSMPKAIGRFDIIRLLGEGAQGKVYLARDPHLDREVAIKTVSLPGGADAQRLLLDEARTIARLQHPNVVTLFDAGEQGGAPYLVFEYVEGTTLARLIRDKGALPVPRAVEIIGHVLDGVAYAHLKGIVHRDLKPSNIMLDGHGVPRVMDFGIASRTEAESGGDAMLIGTPLYMAPEYIRERVGGPRADLFAAGMVLYQMLTGKPAVDGASVPEVLRAIVNQAFTPPSQLNAEVSSALDAVVMKALAKDPADRHGDALEMKKALRKALSPEEQASARPSAESRQSILDFMLRRIRHKSDFPALSQAISTINRVVASEQDGAADLSNAILKDFALTNKLLRLVNTAYYGQFGGTISTISRAVVILGFEAIRNVAITLVLFEHLQNKTQAGQLKDEIITAFFSGIVARQMAGRFGLRDNEEALICAMFHNLGRLLVLYYFHEEAQEIGRLQQQKELSEEEAALQVLGVTFEELGTGVARAWKFPDKMVQSMRRVTDDRARRPQTENERLRLVSGMASEIAQAAGAVDASQQKTVVGELIARYSECVAISREQCESVILSSVQELKKDAIVLNADTRQTPFFNRLTRWEDRAEPASGVVAEAKADAAALTTRSLFGDDLDATILDTGSNPPPATPEEAAVAEIEEAQPQAILAAGIQDITNTLVDDYQVNDVLRMILETMYRGMRFARVLLCIKDVRANMLHGRFGFGPDVDRILREFNVPLGDRNSVFYGALTQGVDILIQDVDSDKISRHIPAWYRKLLPAKSFILFPIVVDKKPIGLFYADKDNLGELEIAARELRMLKTLRNQAVLAIKQKR